MEQQAPVATIIEHFSNIEDPRRYNRRHLLLDIVVIAVCAAICGADDWVAVEAFGQAKLQWLKQFLRLPHGIPAHDTFGQVFAVLDAEQFQSSFIGWVQAVTKIMNGQIVPIDGKKLRRSHDKTIGKDAIHMVSAWASENSMVLGQLKVDDKSNEITAIPQQGCSVLEMLQSVAHCGNLEERNLSRRPHNVAKFLVQDSRSSA